MTSKNLANVDYSVRYSQKTVILIKLCFWTVFWSYLDEYSTLVKVFWFHFV